MGETVYRLFAPNLVTVCIDNYENGDFTGSFWNQYETRPYLFRGSADLLFQMEDLYDRWNFPQRSTNCRSFRQAESEPTLIRPENLVRVKRGKKMGLHNIQDKRGKRGTFIVQVQYRQNSSWQGQVVWAEENKREHFRSALELMKLIDSALSEEESIETGEQAV